MDPKDPRAQDPREKEEEERRSAKAVASGLPEDAPKELAAAARGEAVSANGERRALKYLLGRTRRPTYDAEVDFDTEEGLLPLTFHLQAVDGRRIIEIENEYTSDATGRFDDLGFNAALVAEATVWIADESGEKVEPDSSDFIGMDTIPLADAMRIRFKYQDGLLSGVAGEVRRLGGWSPERVKKARRSTLGLPERISSERGDAPASDSPPERAMEAAAGN